jgi:hypothetical protein
MVDLTFEPHSALSVLGQAVFFRCRSLLSICIPATVQNIPDCCFCQCENLSKVTFESGGKLSSLATFVFDDCFLLKSLCIPASLREVTGLTFVGSRIEAVTVDAGNPHFRVLGDFLVDIGKHSLIRYFGNEPDVTVLSEIEAISAGCFMRCDSVVSVRFEAGSRISDIGDAAFHRSQSTPRSIFLPASLKTISPSCFDERGHATRIVLEAGSRLTDQCISDLRSRCEVTVNGVGHAV